MKMLKVWCPNGTFSKTTLSADDVRRLYESARREGQFDFVARDVGDISLARFRELAAYAVLFIAAFTADGEPAGFAYLTHPEGDACRIHFSISKTGKPFRHCLGRQALKLAFSAFPWQCLIGIVPRRFQGAAQYAAELGGREMGVLPGFCWSARLNRAIDGLQFIFTPEVS